MNIKRLHLVFNVLVLGVCLLLAKASNAQSYHIDYIHSSLNDKDLALLNRMAKFEAMFYNQVFQTTKNDSLIISVNLYGRHGEYNDVQKGEIHTTFIDGFYMGKENKIYLYKSGHYMETLFHETSHNFLRNNYPNAPRWLSEGIATLLGYLVETTDDRVLYMPQRNLIRQVRDSIRTYHFSLDNYFGYKDADWFSQDKRLMLYAGAYSIVFFLVNQEKDHLAPILVSMQHGYSSQAAFKKEFGSIENFTRQFYGYYISGGGKAF
jgi:hypothetical protein